LYPSFLVPEDSPKDPAEQHAEHLHVQQEQSLIGDLLRRQSQIAKTRYPDDTEEDQVIDINEVPQGGDDHRRIEKVLQLWSVCRHSNS
jgi:hypothetical protein